MPETVVDPAVIAGLDFETPCVAYVECTSVAVVDWVCELCGFRGPTCEPHQQTVEEVAAEAVARGLAFTCGGCDRIVSGHYHWEYRKKR
jgi:hypothetical protein